MSKYVAEMIEAYGADPSFHPLEEVSDEGAKEAAYGLTAGLPRVSNGGRVVLWREEPEGRIRVGEWGWSGFEVLGFNWSDWGI